MILNCSAIRYKTCYLVLFLLFSVWSTSSHGSVAIPDSHISKNQITITSGQAIISRPDANNIEIHQISSRLLLDWREFFLPEEAVITIRQPSRLAIVSIQLLDNTDTLINGSIKTNGKLTLLNTQGIRFGTHSAIIAHGLLVSSHPQAPLDVLSPDIPLSATHPESFSTISNKGTLRVINNGLLQMYGGVIHNTGKLLADGGEILLTSTISSDPSIIAISNEGLIQARPTHDIGGSISLKSSACQIYHSGILSVAATDDSDGGSITISSKTRSSLGGNGQIISTSVKGKGGSILIVGEEISLHDDVVVDASGLTGGGFIRIGGDYQGQNPAIQNAVTNYIGEGVTIKADAVITGNGGRIILWSNENTNFKGTLFARGGKKSGDGGFAEISGKRVLQFPGHAKLSANNGQAGSLLLDPWNIYIWTLGTDDLAGTPDDGNANVYAYSEDPGDTANIHPDVLLGILQSGTSIILQAHDYIYIYADIDASAIPAAAGASMTFQAGEDIIIDSFVDIKTNNGTVSMNAGHSGASPTNPLGIGDIVMRTNSVINAGDAPILLTAEGDIQLASISGSYVSATTDNGNIVETAADTNLNINTTGNVILTAGGAIGTAVSPNALDINIGGTLRTLALGGDIFIETSTDLSIDQIETSTTGEDTVYITGTGASNLTFNGLNGYNNTSDDTFYLYSARGSILFQSTNLIVEDLNITTAGTTAGQGDVIINTALSTADKLLKTNSQETGDITITGSASGGSLTGSGSLTTGNCESTTEIGPIARTVNSGDITINVAEEITGIALATGDGNIENANGNDTINIGAINVTGSNVGIQGGAAVSISFGEATGGDARGPGILDATGEAGSGNGDLNIVSSTQVYLRTFEPGQGSDGLLTLTGGSLSVADGAIDNNDASSLRINVQNGSITEFIDNSNTNISFSGNVDLVAATGIGVTGSPRALDINVGGTLGLQVTNSGGIYIETAANLTIDEIRTANTIAGETVSIAATGNSDLLFTGGAGYQYLESDNFTVNSATGSVTFQTTPFSPGSLTVTTAGTATGEGDVIINTAVSSSSVIGAGHRASGDITISGTADGGSLTGSGSLTTGNATSTTDNGLARLVSSGDISIDMAEEVENVSIRTGDVLVQNLTGFDDNGTVGDVTITASHIGVDGGTALPVSLGTASAYISGISTLNVTGESGSGNGDINISMNGNVYVNTFRPGADSSNGTLSATGVISLADGGIVGSGGTMAISGASILPWASGNATHIDNSGPIVLSSATSIGASTREINIASSPDVTLTSNENMYVNHDGTTKVWDLEVNKNSSGGPWTYSLTNFLLAGDINGDIELGLEDCIRSLQVVTGDPGGAGISTDGDINSDGDIGIAETIYVLRKISQ